MARAMAAGLGRLALGLTLLGGLPGIIGHRVALMRLEDALARQPGVAGVIGPREQPGACWKRGAPP